MGQAGCMGERTGNTKQLWQERGLVQGGGSCEPGARSGDVALPRCRYGRHLGRHVGRCLAVRVRLSYGRAAPPRALYWAPEGFARGRPPLGGRGKAIRGSPILNHLARQLSTQTLKSRCISRIPRFYLRFLCRWPPIPGGAVGPRRLTHTRSHQDGGLRTPPLLAPPEYQP